MLNVYFGPMPEAIYNTAVYFKNTYEDKWITAPLAVEMIADVDRSKVVGPQVIESPVLGIYSKRTYWGTNRQTPGYIL